MHLKQYPTISNWLSFQKMNLKKLYNMTQFDIIT